MEVAVDMMLKAMTLKIAEKSIGGTQYLLLYYLMHFLPQSFYDHVANKFYKV